MQATSSLECETSLTTKIRISYIVGYRGHDFYMSRQVLFITAKKKLLQLGKICLVHTLQLTFLMALFYFQYSIQTNNLTDNLIANLKHFTEETLPSSVAKTYSYGD